jgi:hypothetical protein
VICLLVGGWLPACALGERIRAAVYPYDERQEESGADPGPALPVEVRVSVPDGGRIKRDSRRTWIWTGPRDSAGCRVALTIEARAQLHRDPDLEHGQPPRTWYSARGVRIGVSRVALDDTRSPFGYARFRLPKKLAPSTDHRVVYVLVTSNRGQGRCIRRLRSRGASETRRALRTIAVHPR